MHPIEQAYYNAWAQRLQAALAQTYPNTLWLVLDLADVIKLSAAAELPRQFSVRAMTKDASRHSSQDLPFRLAVDEATFTFVVVALGRELERRLAVRH